MQMDKYQNTPQTLQLFHKLIRHKGRPTASKKVSTGTVTRELTRSSSYWMIFIFNFLSISIIEMDLNVPALQISTSSLLLSIIQYAHISHSYNAYTS